MARDVKIGVEQVLYAAAADPAFRRALLASRDEALASRALRLSEGERALLRGVPDAQLSATIASMDVSPDNRQRRSFLRVVATGAMTVAAAEVLGACSDGADKGVRPDLPDQAVPDTTRPDAAPDAGADSKEAADKGWLDIKTSWGSRPGG